MPDIPSQFSGVTVATKANIYFDGGVVSHTLHLPDGTKLTLGLIRPGSYHFNTGPAEGMEIVAGSCSIKLDAAKTWTPYETGSRFEIPANSGFTVEVAKGICEYICTFLKERESSG